MKTLKEIYIEYEIGEIYPENLPNELIKAFISCNINENLVRISKMQRPTRADIHSLLDLAFEINENEKLTKYEKFEFLINRWLANKLDSNTLLNRIKYFELENVIIGVKFDIFMKYLNNTVNGVWVPGDEWDWAIDNLKEEFKFENKYSEFLIS